MKIRKRAEQGNVKLNDWMYTRYQLEEMLKSHEIFFIDEDTFRPCYETRFYDNKEFRIFLDDMREIKVIYHEGSYTNVVVANSGKQYFVEL